MKFRNLKKCLSLFLAMLMVLTCVPVVALAAETEESITGICGPDATWTLEDGTLTISGTGEIHTYFEGIPAWYLYMETITDVIIEEGITAIGDYLFSYCENLSSVSIPNSVTAINDYAFSDCNNLANVTLGNGITTIKEHAFTECESLTSINIPNSVTTIDYGAFSNCTKLANITIPDSVTYIGLNAFSGTAYTANESNWENGVLYIGNHLINAEDSLTGIYEIKEGTKTIAEDAFWNCEKLTEIVIPDSLINLNATFDRLNDRSSTLVISPNNPNFTYEDEILFNKDKTVLINFPSSSDITNYTIPDGVTSIGEFAFENCTNLTSITIPYGVTNIGYGVFKGCKSLTDITIPYSVTSIGRYAFESCSSLVDVTIPEGVTTIDYMSFSNCKNLTSITIPDSVTRIGGGAFSACSKLSSITIPDSVTSIGSSAFGNTKYYDNENNWDNDVLYVGNHLVDAKNSLTGEYAVKEGTKTISSYAFTGCNNLTKLIIPNSVINIDPEAISSCENLEEVFFADNPIGVNSKLNIIATTFINCVNLKKVTLGNRIANIPALMFFSCASLEEIYIPATVEYVDWWAFFLTGLTDIYFESENTEIFNFSLKIEDMLYATLPETTTIHAPCRNSTSSSLEFSNPAAYAKSIENTFVSIDDVHNFTEWTTTKEATLNEAGERERYCAVCNAKETETIEYVAINNINVNVSDVVLEKDNTTTIVVTTTPDNATNPAVTYTSADKTVATVDNNGTITAVDNGETVITVEAVENPAVKATVNVKVSVPVTSFETNITVGELVEGETTTVTATLPAEIPADDVTVIYESEDENIATVDGNGVITGVTAGTTNIIVTVTDSFGNEVVEKVTLTVKAAYVPVTDITVEVEGEINYVGDKLTITATATPDNATHKKLTFTSSDTSVVTVDANGKITAIGPGPATVTITSTDGITKEFSFTVKAKPIINVEAPTDVKIGDTGTIVVVPNVEGTYVTEYEVSDESVVKVDENGNLVAVGKGTATVTAKVTLEDGTVITKEIVVKSVDPNEGKFFCSFCDDYEAMKDSPVGFIYTIIHFFIHMIQSINFAT